MVIRSIGLVKQHELVVDAMFAQSHTSPFEKFVFMAVVGEVVIREECGVDWTRGSSGTGRRKPWRNVDSCEYANVYL